jgi:hypothetical protein
VGVTAGTKDKAWSVEKNALGPQHNKHSGRAPFYRVQLREFETMAKFKEEWSMESAMAVLSHPTVDSEIWAAAVEWLLVYGPPEIRVLLQQASGQATAASFPDLKPDRYAPDGSPCYDIARLAESLGISEEEAKAQITEQERRHGIRHGFDEDETTPLQ